MRTLTSVIREINSLPSGFLFGTRKEVRELARLLEDNEVIIGICSGFLDGNTWIITATNKRVLFLDKGFFYGIKSKEFLLNKINSITYTKGLMFGTMSISHGSESLTVGKIPRTSVDPFVKAVRSAINEPDFYNNYKTAKNEKEDSLNKNVTDNSLDNIAKIREYKSLLDDGIISQEEFDKKKQELLKL